jgi:hypothetical protein
MDYGTSFHTFFKLEVFGRAEGPKNRNFPIANIASGGGSR